ncbi:Arv1-like family-domain-containing protein [Lipomyces japonicus]|uniref:Arv1-like family-domain-containing protein n=1 Tax=Lipomyces japonicus TaxID=56871 RepID=UPI0034CD11B3
MMCIECAYPVTSLYTEYSSNNIRLTACPNCHKFADKYIEHDSVLIFIDLALIKPQVYRHLAFNRLSISPHLQSTARRMFVLVTLFDVYLTWARVEKEVARVDVDEATEANMLAIQRRILQFPVLAQYLFFLVYCLAETAVTHTMLRFLAGFFFRNPDYKATGDRPIVARYNPNTVTIALIMSSATKLFPMLMVIWSYDIPAAAKAVGWAVNVSTVEALNIVLRCGYPTAIGLLVLTALTRRIVVNLFVIGPVARHLAAGNVPSGMFDIMKGILGW